MELRLKLVWCPRNILLLIALVATGCATTPASRRVPLPQFIGQTTAESPFHQALWGILIEEEDGPVLYSRNADVLMMPASNRKLFVSALASSCLGVASSIPTELWIDGWVSGESLFGNLVLKGFGDPSLGGRYDADRDARLQPLLDALRDRGITYVTGSVIGDVSRFDRETIPGSWKYDNLGSSYAAPVDALAWNENAVGVLLDARDCASPFVTTDPHIVSVQIELNCAPRADTEEEVTPSIRAQQGNLLRVEGELDLETALKPYLDLVGVEDPGLYAAAAVDDFLERNGIEIAGAPLVQAEPREWTEKAATIESPPLYLLLGTFLKVSQNLYGEMFFKASARELPASYEGARAVERMFLINEVGLSGTDFGWADGSGLSVENLVSPRAIVKLLRYMNRPETFELYYQLLATPGEEGTLQRRLAGLEMTMRGKTGTIDGVNALSGYVIGRKGRLRYFSIIANHHIGSSSSATAIIDGIVRRIADF